VRILILSDIHGNLAALEAVLRAAGSVEAVWNLGDTVGYGPCPRQCLARTQEINAHPTLAGNHDLAAIGRIDTSTFNPAARAAAEWTAANLEDEDKAYLASLPSMTVHGDVTLAHGSPRSPVWEYITTDEAATENFAHFENPVCFFGHTHVASVAALSEDRGDAELHLMSDGMVLDLSVQRWLINPGSVGQPRDRDPRAAFAILDTDQVTLIQRRVAYEIAATQSQMAAAGLPESLIRRLSIGV
jgi:predicted phosphodiesterase